MQTKNKHDVWMYVHRLGFILCLSAHHFFNPICSIFLGLFCLSSKPLFNRPVNGPHLFNTFHHTHTLSLSLSLSPLSLSLLIISSFHHFHHSLARSPSLPSFRLVFDEPTSRLTHQYVP